MESRKHAGKPAQTTIAESGLGFLLEKLAKILADLGDCLFCRMPDTEIDQAVAEMRSSQKFRREISNSLDRYVRRGQSLPQF